uniref:Uncharacterized protein n=1 Tax=Roseihalotalea indica TaxID=2867963 RepID=A0AA49GJI0_9BACT|nr:hypothetical protein K4G66_18795 [Tunicatimonas sp. TK19036]
MKRNVDYLLTGLLLFLFARAGWTQQVLPVEDRMLADTIAENVSRNTQQAGYLALISQLTKNTRDEVEATRELQYDYQDHLRQTQSTAGLNVSDQQSPQQSVSQVMIRADHLLDYRFAYELSQAYRAVEEPLQKSQKLYDQLTPYRETSVFTDLASFTSLQQEQLQNRIALEEMNVRRKVQLAQLFRQLAQSKIAQSEELQRKLTQDQAFSMTEAQRLEMLCRLQQCLGESQQLSTRADALLGQVSRPSKAKAYALERYEQAQIRSVMATTPLFNH